LLTSVRASGLPVTCEISGPEAALPPGVDLTAYRIIQEALTNALRHAPGASATVTVTREDRALSLKITNTAPQPPVTATAPGTRTAPATAAAPPTPVSTATPVPPDTLAGGYGLAGIAERVASCGGSLALGPTAAGGFTVTARLPLT
jgi:signal transduction histidine kinase